MSANMLRMRRQPEMPTGTEVAAYKSYEEATKAVELLGEHDFPLNAVTIVGSDVHIAESILGRLTPARVALTGATQGLTWGLLMGLFVLILMPQGGALLPLVAMAMGVLAGVLISSLTWGLSSRKRTFASQTAIVASRFAVLVAENADRAFQILNGSPGNISVPTTSAPRPRTHDRRYGEMVDAKREAEVATPDETQPQAIQRSSAGDEKPKFGVRLEDLDDRSSPPNDSGAQPPAEEEAHHDDAAKPR